MSLKVNAAAYAEELNKTTDARTAAVRRLFSFMLMLMVMFALNGMGC